MDDRAGDGLISGLVLGAMAGAAGVYAMNQVAQSIYRRTDAATRATEKAVLPGGMDPAHILADRVTRAAGMELAHKDRNAAGMLITYAAGVVPAALYGALRDRFGFIGAMRGLLFGIAAFAAEDEYAKPRLGLSAAAGRYPWQSHARGLAAHMAFGLATDAALRVLKGPPR